MNVANDNHPFTTVDRVIVMMNCSFKLDRFIQLRRLCACFISSNKTDDGTRGGYWSAVYDPDRYPAVNARYIDRVKGIKTSVFVFGTGSVVIAAGKSADDLYTTYASFLNDIYQAYLATLGLLLVERPDDERRDDDEHRRE